MTKRIAHVVGRNMKLTTIITIIIVGIVGRNLAGKALGMTRLRYYLLILFVIITPMWIMEFSGADILVMQELKDIKKKDGEH